MVEFCCAAEARAKVAVLPRYLYEESESDLNPGPYGASQLQLALANNNVHTSHHVTPDPRVLGLTSKVSTQHGRANVFVDGTSRFSEVRNPDCASQLRAATLDMKI